MVNLQGFKPYHPGADESKKMECDHHSGSPILNTQEVAFAEEHGVYPEKVEFITVKNNRRVHWMKFPTSYFGAAGSVKLSFMEEWTTHVLAKVAPPKPKSFQLRNIPEIEGDTMITNQYLIFQVSSEEDAKIACQHGGQAKEEGGRPTLFVLYTPDEQAMQQGRILRLAALGFNITTNDILSAMKRWGEVESVKK
ncbi:hypothetical protein FBU30_001808, partial [Linnemannia zychae]